MRKAASIALIAMLGMASPVVVSQQAAAQEANQLNQTEQYAWPALVAAGTVILSVTIALLVSHHHHQVSP